MSKPTLDETRKLPFALRKFRATSNPDGKLHGKPNEDWTWKPAGEVVDGAASRASDGGGGDLGARVKK